MDRPERAPRERLAGCLEASRADKRLPTVKPVRAAQLSTAHSTSPPVPKHWLLRASGRAPKASEASESGNMLVAKLVHRSDDRGLQTIRIVSSVVR